MKKTLILSPRWQTAVANFARVKGSHMGKTILLNSAKEETNEHQYQRYP